MNLKLDDIPYLCPIDEKWENRPKSNIVKHMMSTNYAGLEFKDMAHVLGTTETYFNNKIYRDSFSFEDLVILAEACGFSVCFIDKEGDRHFKPTMDIEAVYRIKDLKRQRIDSKMRKYKELKAEVEKLKKELKIEKGDS